MFIYKNIPNILTCFRILIIPVIIASFYIHDSYLYARKITALLFLTASITDFLDGYIARKYNLESKLGIILDPIADKILVNSILLMLIAFNQAPAIPCVIILARELMVCGVREFSAINNLSISVSELSKWKAAIQMIAILVLIVGSKEYALIKLNILGCGLLWTASILSVISSIDYLHKILAYLNNKK